MIVDLLNRFEPDPHALLRVITPHITDEMLECISKADYGEEANEHLAALREIRDTGNMPENPGWVPMEVLELIRWSEPNDPNWRPGERGEFGHWMRAFSCAALLRAECKPGSYHDDPGRDSTTIQLICSLDTLPVDLSREAVRTFAWLLLRLNPKDEHAREYGIALLWFALHLEPRISDDELVTLAQWTVKHAEELKRDLSLAEFPGLKQMVIGCQKRSAWEEFGMKLAELDMSSRSPELRTWLRLIAEQLVD